MSVHQSILESLQNFINTQSISISSNQRFRNQYEYKSIFQLYFGLITTLRSIFTNILSFRSFLLLLYIVYNILFSQFIHLIIPICISIPPSIIFQLSFTLQREGFYIQTDFITQFIMDLNKERLKNRLNVKFQPLKMHSSTKKLSLVQKYKQQVAKQSQRQRQKDTSVLDNSRNRSITHLRLPSLQKKSATSKKVQQKTQQIINIREMRQRIKSIKILPTIKVQSKQPINDTITYLIKNEILNIPKIVAMLQKSQSQEFLYMKVCNQQQKGSSYITVSKNGMVRDGELTTLPELIYEYQIYNKLKKNPFFRYYLAIKFMNKWNRGSKAIKFVENKQKIKKLMFLDNERILAWRVELRNMLFISDKGGHINSGWVNKVAKEIENNKSQVQQKLLHVSMKLLQKFDLPLSDSFELMNKSLGNLLSLNMSFEKKIRIQKQLQIVYKTGMMLQFYQLQAIAFFLITHIEQVSYKFQQRNQLYLANILIPIQELDFNHVNYIADKQKIISATTMKQEINFKMLINQYDEIIIEPSIKSILAKIKNDIKEFINKVQNFNYKIIRVPKFDFVVKNVIKPHQIDSFGSHNKEVNLKEYIFSINAYFERMKELEQNAEKIQRTIERKKYLMKPFFSIYLKYRQKSQGQLYLTYSYQQISEQIQRIQQDSNSCKNKLHDGQYFILGYLSQLQIKQQIITFLKDYKQSILATIPQKIRQNKEIFNKNLEKHLEILRTVIKSADDYIKVYSQCDSLEEKVILYTSDLSEIEKLQELYLRIKKIESLSLVEEKGLLNELKMKMKNYRQTKQSSYLIYKKALDQYKKEFITKVQSIVPSEEYYVLTEYPVSIFNRCHENNKKLHELNEQLKHLNQLQAFFDIKLTQIPKLQTLVVKFESLQEIWYIYKELSLEKQNYFDVNIMKIDVLPLIKKYEQFTRKCQRYIKDPDYFILAEHLIEAIPLLLSSFYIIQDIQNPVLRQIDYDQITSVFQKEKKVQKPTKQLTFHVVYSKKLYQHRQIILEINFKSHKEQQIAKLLKQYEVWWKAIKLQGQYLQQYPLVIIFNENDQLRKEIQEFTLTLLNIINHKYGGFARKQCHNNLRNINNLASILEQAIIHQEKFLALYPILTSKYAQKQLPSQAKKFMTILQKTMKNVKWLIKPTQNLNDNTRTLLSNHTKQFDAISKTITHFLEKKRVKFQRFYFLQDDELLQVLVGIGTQNTIFRMFEGIKGWIVDKQGVKYGVEGIGNEHLVLRGWSYKNQQPEVIFKSLEDAIKTNLNSIVRNILHGYQNQLKELKNLYPKMPWMCVYTVELVLYTKQIQINCLQNGIDFSLQANLIQENIASSVANPLENSNYITLQLFLLHYTQQLLHENVQSIFDFKWHSFLRYYYEKDCVVMKTLGSEHQWGGEYQGLWNLMINTSDIRRAHTSILSSIQFGNGVLLQGPSGTGKTQSLKQLARCMAKYCVVFNCSSKVNVRTLQKLLSGLCYTGSWLCLDQINRLTSQIMSVVANQINSIRNAIIQSKQVFNFMGKDMRLKKGVGIFSTMNPIYLKRAKLTQSLKSYFRIISVNVPDYEKILEVMLYSLGITSSSSYAHKISMMFKNLSIQLSLRSQYDFGLRAMKFFIFNLSIIRRNSKNEEESIIQALCQTFYSRLEADDKESFSKIINDMFGKKMEQKSVNFKVSMMKQAPQTGIIVLGPTSSKTTLINEYINLYDKQSTVTQIFNPNSLELKYFLGQSVNIGRWEQGIVQKMARGSFQNNNKNYILVLDSKLKSQTIQNFNTLLDDSKLLSLSNGTRLKIQNNFKIIMQTPDLQMTSPATITRCNVIFVSEADIDKKKLIQRIIPIFNTLDMNNKVKDILDKFTISQIQKIIKISKLVFFRRILAGQKLTQSQSIGFEKCLFYSLQILQKSQRVKSYLNKDNSVVSKKSIFHYYLNFNKFKEGQFVQFDLSVKQIQIFSGIYIPTIRNKFYEYINIHSYSNRENVLWKGQRMNGKTSSILFSLQQIFKSHPQDKNMLKIPINPYSNSKSISSYIEDKITVKDADQSTLVKTLLVYIDDIHLANEEIVEFIKFTAQHRKFFSYKNKQIIQFPKHTLIGDSNNYYSKEFISRFSRHFAQINLPSCEDSYVKSIFHGLLKNIIGQTKTSIDFKSTYQLELERIVNFFVQYLKISNKSYKQSFNEGLHKKNQLQYLGYCSLLPIINNFKILNDNFCKEISDLISFSFSELRSQQVELRKSIKQIDFIKLAYNQIFKHKFQQQYDKTLKSSTGHPSQVMKYSGLTKGTISLIRKWEEYSTYISNKLQNKYYLSQFMMIQILKISRIIEWNGGNYYLIGTPGVGRKTILKIACFLAEKEVIDTLPSQQKSIAEWYFGLLKISLEKHQEYCVIIDLDKRQNFKILEYIQKINNRHPITQQIISNENCEYAYSSINELLEVEYDKYTKSYDEVITDFMAVSKKRLRFLLYSASKSAEQFINNFHYLHQQTQFRFIQEIPSDSIIQISSQILQNGLSEECDRKRLTNVFLKIYHDLTNLMKENENNNKNHFKYNPFYHYKVIKQFIKNYTKVQDKAKEKEDILNRSILKVHQISQILEKLKVEIKEMEPRVKEKTQKLLEVVPVLQAKKKASQQVKRSVLNEKKQIQNRNLQIEQMMKEVQQKISRAEPILQQANDSMQTLKRTQLSQLRNNPNPHPLIKLTLENMVILLGQNQSWQNIKKILSDTSLLTKLKNISPNLSNILKAKKKIDENREWTFQNVSKVSYGVRHIVRWINNIIKFYELKYALDSQKQKVEQYKKQLISLQQKLAGKQVEFDMQQQQVKIIQQQYNENKNQLLNLQQIININNRKFQNAELIKSHLHEQINSWYDSLNQSKTLKKNSQAISIMVTLYLQVFNVLHLEEQAKIQDKLKDHFKKLAFTYDPNFDVLQYIKSDIIRKTITKQQNPQNFSFQNLSIQDTNNSKIIQTLYHFNKRPILLDPDNQATSWIQKQLSYEGEKGIKAIIAKQSFNSSANSIQSAIKQGHILVLIIEDDLDQFTSEILNSKITETSGSKIIEYKKNIVYIHPNFRLLLCNKSRNPNLSNKLYIDHPILNFEITKDILKNILLQQLVMLENKEIYEVRKQIEMQKKQNEKIISEIEEQIIQSLINSKKTLIDDNDFINLLTENQSKRGALKQNQAEWKHKNYNIKKIYDNYDGISRTASEIFMSLKYMTKINPLLSWNCEIFVQYFKQAVSLSISTPLFDIQDDDEPEIKILKQSNFEFDHYSLGLGNSRPTSALSYMSGMTSKVIQQERKDDFDNQHPTSTHAFENLTGFRQMNVDEKQLGTMSAEREKSIRNKLIEFVKFAFTEQQRIIWGLIICLQNTPLKDIKMLIEAKAKHSKLKQCLQAGQLPEKVKNLISQNDKFQQQLQKSLSSSNPYTKFGDQLSEVQYLLLSKLLYPNHFNNLCKTMIRSKGYDEILSYTEIKTVNWFQRSDNVHPILLIMGQDPISRISEYLTQKKYKNVILIPMGEGQNKLAETVLQKQSKKQNLVIIHNLQISDNFILYLSKMLQQFQIRPPHKNFRLILISTLFQGLNEEITSYCHKYIIEQPTGIKNQIKYLRQINTVDLIHPTHKKLEFVLTYVHSIVNNLSKYKPFGWNLKYEFNTTDFLNSVQIMKDVLESKLDLGRFECNLDLQQQKDKLDVEQIDYKALRYMIGEIGYIGKLADDIDRSKMKIIIDQFINPNIFKPQIQNQSGLKKAIRFSKLDLKNIDNMFEGVDQSDASIFGLHSSVKPISQYSSNILFKLGVAYDQVRDGSEGKNDVFLKPIQPINHKFQYINKEIAKYNEYVDRMKVYGSSENSQRLIGSGLLLSSITSVSRIFNLKSFSNPRQFFIAIKKDVAYKNNVIFEKVQLVWSLLPKQNLSGVYGISNLNLEGGSFNLSQTTGYLDDGFQQKDITVYVQGVVRKKEKEAKKTVNIPLYLEEERQGQINSYGDNTNLLVKIKIEATHPQEFWTLRGTAFVVI